MHWWGGGWNWGWPMVVGMVLFWTLIGVAIWALVRTVNAPRSGSHQSAEEILAERFARGEISAEEFQERRRVLGGRLNSLRLSSSGPAARTTRRRARRRRPRARPGR